MEEWDDDVDVFLSLEDEPVTEKQPDLSLSTSPLCGWMAGNSVDWSRDELSVVATETVGAKSDPFAFSKQTSFWSPNIGRVVGSVKCSGWSSPSPSSMWLPILLLMLLRLSKSPKMPFVFLLLGSSNGEVHI